MIFLKACLFLCLGLVLAQPSELEHVRRQLQAAEAANVLLRKRVLQLSEELKSDKEDCSETGAFWSISTGTGFIAPGYPRGEEYRRLDRFLAHMLLGIFKGATSVLELGCGDAQLGHFLLKHGIPYWEGYDGAINVDVHQWLCPLG
eukprot:TRINITY_DN51981_c0_g1_i1.p1 TRINITY_DN51981_c0_g1~~TRINITY_DN51981_c0_g1_i1.p1  ORF type:complete len:146 (+),score=19.68 TRINITY_DN51981_c0_g1_i1:132-569(+)